MNVDSIHNLQPLDTSGRSARGGFIYQDHLGVHFCMEMLMRSDIKQVWFEREDDIALVKNTNNEETIEFIQVKHNESKTSRWSIADITRRDGTRIGTSLLEKLFSNDRCSEKTEFQIATSYGYRKDELNYMNSPRESLVRNQNKTDEAKLLSELNGRLGSFKSENGNDWEYFLSNCVWKKYPGTIEAIRSINILRFERIVSQLGFTLSINRREELYEKLLSKVRYASTCDLSQDPTGYKIEIDSLIRWLEEEIEREYSDSQISKLTEKMYSASISDGVANYANHLRVKYKNNRLNTTYISEVEFDKLEGEIEYFLHSAMAKLNSGELNLNGPQFHSYCLERVNKIGERYPSEQVKFIAAGYMYDITNRCMHKFAV